MIMNKDFITSLQEFQDKFSEFFNIAALIFDDKGNAITEPSGFTNLCKLIRASEIGGKRCRESKKGLFNVVSDGEPKTYKCAIFPEIADAVVPIMYKGDIIAAWAIGQKRIGVISDERLNKVANEFGIDNDVFLAAYNDFPITDEEEFNRAIYFMFNTVQTIMKTMEQSDKLGDITSITAHNIKEDLSIILGYADLIALRYSNVLDDDLTEYLRLIRDHSMGLRETAQSLIAICERDN